MVKVNSAHDSSNEHTRKVQKASCNVRVKVKHKGMDLRVIEYQTDSIWGEK